MSRHMLVLLTAVAAVAIGEAFGDVMTLRSGGEVRGRFVKSEEDEAAGTKTVTIETLSGARITVSEGDVETVEHRSRRVEEYVARAAGVANTVEAQWELAQWCRRNRLDDREMKHLEAVIALEPDHEGARRGLEYVLRDGAWIKQAEMMRGRGLVKHGRRWVTPQERDLIVKTEAQREREEAWYSDIRLWHTWLTSGNSARYRKAVDKLRKVRDAAAIPALSKYFSETQNASARMIYLGVLKRIPGSAPAAPLVTQYLHDVDQLVRESAMQAIVAEHEEASLPYLLAGLRHENNKVVRRAGAALEKVGDERAVPDLIKALITAHSRTIQVPVQVPTTTFSSNGAFGPSGVPLPPEIEMALRTGRLPYGVGVHSSTKPAVRWRTQTIRVNRENDEVLAALEAITGESLGFDERMWQRWWTGKKSGL